MSRAPAGLNPAAIADPAAHYGRPDVFEVIALEQEQSVADQIDLGTLAKVVGTHLHWDHVGGLQLIPASVPVVIQRTEWRPATTMPPFSATVMPLDYADEGRELILIDGDHDLLGDGRIDLLLTRGHTPGHQSIRIGDLVLGIDVAHFASGLDDHRVPVFADDHEQPGAGCSEAAHWPAPSVS